MKNLGRYILPQIFNNVMFKYHKNQLLEHVNMNEIEKDLPKEFSSYEIMFSFIELYYGRWKITIEKNNSFKDLFWDKEGKFLGFFDG